MKHVIECTSMGWLAAKAAPRHQMLGHSFWEGFAYLVMRSYCQKWHLDIADFRGGMSTAPVPFARCICWEQELTNQNLKEVTRFSCYFILTRQHLGRLVTTRFYTLLRGVMNTMVLKHCSSCFLIAFVLLSASQHVAWSLRSVPAAT